MIRDFSGKVAVITGAASGIGRALGEEALKHGMTLYATDIEADALQDAYQDRATCLALDVADAAAMAALAEQVYAEQGACHLLCNNAGVMKTGWLTDYSADDVDWMLGVNIKGVMNGIRAFVPAMKNQSAPAHVVNTGSIAGLTATPSSGLYAITKHGVVALSETLLYEMQMQGADVGVTVLCPGPVKTQILNWDRYGKADTDPAFPTDRLQSLIDAQGVTPEALAAQTFAAVEEGRFWVFTDDRFRAALDNRVQSIASGENPAFQPAQSK
ncbi:MAG: SDR family NAD(P)-dependent oxidoreductase [Alphaproteobacteria bacterium]